MFSFYKNPMSNFVRVWGLWSNFVKVCLSSVLVPLGVACCFPGWKLWQYGWSALWDFNKKYRTFCKNAQSATYLDAWWNPAKIPFMSGSWCVPLGSYALPVDMIALLEEQQFWQLWHTELFSEKTCLIFGTQPDGFECVNSCHCNSSPAAEIVICGSNYSAKGGALGLLLKQQEKVERVLSGDWQFSNSIAQVLHHNKNS